MEENLSLKSSSRNKVKSTVSGIKKLLKDKKLDPKQNAEESNVIKIDSKEGRGNNYNRAVVYIGHIPSGFYEEQMRRYFGQFGTVTNVRVARSKKTGSSKGYGFIEFQDREVAEVVAETMNNYLMDKRLLKAECLPINRDTSTMFRGENWGENKKHPGLKSREKSVNKVNKTVTQEQWIEYCKKQLNKIHQTQSKLKGYGIDFNFTINDIPDEFINYNPSIDNSKSKGKNKKSSNIPNKSDSEELESNSPIIKIKKKSKRITKKEIPAEQSKKKKIPKKHIGVLAPPSNYSMIRKEDNETLHKIKKTGGIQKRKSSQKNIINENAIKKLGIPLMYSDYVKILNKYV